MTGSLSTAAGVLLVALVVHAPESAQDGEVAPGEVGAANEPTLVVVNKGASTLSILDPASHRQVAAVPTGRAPHEVAVSADGRTAYVTDYGTGERPGNTVTIIDIVSAERVGAIDLGTHTRPHGIAVARDGTLWVTTEGSGHVVQVDPESRRVLRAVPTGQRVTHMVALAEEHGRLYTANIGSGTVTAIELETGQVLAQIETGAGAEGIDAAPDGEHVYVTNRAAGTFSEIDVETNQVTRTLSVGEFPIRVAVRPGGDRALITDPRAGEVIAVDLARWEVARRLTVDGAPIGILVPPSDGVAYVADTSGDRVMVIDLDAWEVTGTIPAGAVPDGLGWAGLL